MSKAKPPERGDQVVLRQTYHADPRPPHYGFDEQGRQLMTTRHIPATVTFVLRRGAFDVVTDGAAKHRVNKYGTVDYVRGTVRALRWRGGWLRPDQLDAYCDAEASRGPSPALPAPDRWATETVNGAPVEQFLASCPTS